MVFSFSRFSILRYAVDLNTSRSSLNTNSWICGNSLFTIYYSIRQYCSTKFFIINFNSICLFIPFISFVSFTTVLLYIVIVSSKVRSLKIFLLNWFLTVRIILLDISFLYFGSFIYVSLIISEENCPISSLFSDGGFYTGEAIWFIYI